jgi:hypothetical protein
LADLEIHDARLDEERLVLFVVVLPRELLPCGADSLSTVGPQTRGYFKTIKTFSDGTFQFDAVPPGVYIISMDPQDLIEINCTAAVMRREVTVQAKPEGDTIDGINFEIQGR